ncbi:ATP-dependent helicase [Vitreimonas sp.]|uniref:ATP-dependent helicase n=1 Tax=Vitreimonas sp. TaxID=3069702 RepID=UPI002EDAAB2A
MTVVAVEGVAGSGKTVRLMETLAQKLSEAPLRDGQRVLALTFMHGARRRLHEKLYAMRALRGRIECATIDSFAQRLVRRWRGTATAIGTPPLENDQYDEQCAAAADLLARQEVAAWIATSFPIVLIDEAQDLKPERLRMVEALASGGLMLIAADEFQCLDPGLRPNPCVAWMRTACAPTVLTKVHRTDVAELLSAAAAIRTGIKPQVGSSFKILKATGAYMPAAFLANAIQWRQGGNVAVITPSLSGGFARDVVERVTQNQCGKHKSGPFPIRWERSDGDEAAGLAKALLLSDGATSEQTIAALELLLPSGAIKDTIAWVRLQAHAAGVTVFHRAEIDARIARHVSMRRQRSGTRSSLFTALTVQQAKNREFEGVVILWPYQVGGDDEHKRRLLYNAVTRAQRWCTVILQGGSLLKAAPFA